MAPRGKIPSLIGGTLGRPKRVESGKRTPCSRCHRDILKGATCYDVPQLRKPHESTRRFCQHCFDEILKQTQKDLNGFC